MAKEALEVVAFFQSALRDFKESSPLDSFFQTNGHQFSSALAHLHLLKLQVPNIPRQHARIGATSSVYSNRLHP